MLFCGFLDKHGLIDFEFFSVDYMGLAEFMMEEGSASREHLGEGCMRVLTSKLAVPVRAFPLCGRLDLAMDLAELRFRVGVLLDDLGVYGRVLVALGCRADCGSRLLLLARRFGRLVWGSEIDGLYCEAVERVVVVDCGPVDLALFGGGAVLVGCAFAGHGVRGLLEGGGVWGVRCYDA